MTSDLCLVFCQKQTVGKTTTKNARNCGDNPFAEEAGIPVNPFRASELYNMFIYNICTLQETHWKLRSTEPSAWLFHDDLNDVTAINAIPVI